MAGLTTGMAHASIASMAKGGTDFSGFVSPIGLSSGNT
jgi:hypothetical protein